MCTEVNHYLAAIFTHKGLPHGSVVKNPPAIQEMQETQVRSLGQEDPPEKELAALSRKLARKIPWMEEEEPGRLQSVGSHRIRHN